MEVRVMPHLGVPELLIILVIIILIFGVGKLPQIGKALGQGIREFRESSQGVEGEEAPEGGSSQSAEV
jgi:sec-independent protein translocase protein TatA